MISYKLRLAGSITSCVGLETIACIEMMADLVGDFS